MKILTVLLTLLLAAGLLGCGKQQPRHIVILPDVSGSIERQALEQTFKAIDDLVGQLHRGDRITIIPILGDAQAEASGRIIRFEVPKERRAYDADLRQFRAKLREKLEHMKSNAIVEPELKTDILGSVELAQQEFETDNRESERLLVILSDFIQEDRNINFKSTRLLGNRLTVQNSARPLTGLHNVRVYLGLLLSPEYGAMSRRRRDAIREFWLEYFKASGAQARFVTDGPGMLPQYFPIGIP